MAKHRYWRLSGLRPYDGGATIELSELWLLNGTTRADSGAALTSSVAPVSGTLSNLQDGNPATLAVLATGSAVVWDLGTATEATNIQVGAGDTLAKFLLGCALERSDDGVVWREYQLLRNWQGIKWPGARMLTANVLRTPPLSHLTVRMSFEPTAWQNNEYGPALTFAATGSSVTPNTATPIKGSRSIDFSGTGYLGITFANAFPVAAGSDFTIQARVRATSATAGNRVIAAFGGLGSATNTVSVQLDPSTGTVQLVASGATVRFVASAAGAVALNTNTHIAGSSENGVLRVFVNGVLLATSTGLNSVNNLGFTSSADLRIGGYGGAAANTFLGTVDEVGIDLKCLYFNDFTPPDFIVPQAEWQIDAYTAAPVSYAPFRVPSLATGLTLPYGQVKVPEVYYRVRGDYYNGSGLSRVRGTVKNKGTPNAPVFRKVRLYRERDGLLVREQWSNPVTGAYDFRDLEDNVVYTVVSYDHTLNYRMVAADRAVVEPMP